MDPRNTKRWFNLVPQSQLDGYSAEVEIYDEIGGWGIHASEFIRDIKSIEGRILVRIQSGGGSVFDAVAIYNYLKSRKGGVDTIVDGLAASAASIILMAGEKRSIGTGAFVMVHRASTFFYGSAEEIRKTAEDLEKIEQGIRDIYVKETGKPDEEIGELFDGEDHWLNATESTEWGFTTDTFEQLQAVAKIDLTAVTQRYGTAPAALSEAFENKTQIKEPTMKHVLNALGLGADSDEAAVVKAVNKLQADASAAQSKAEELETKNAELNEKLNTASSALEVLAEKQANELVENAVKDRKIKEEAKATWIENAKNNYDGTKSLIDSITVQASGRTPIPFQPSGDQPQNATQKCAAANGRVTS